MITINGVTGVGGIKAVDGGFELDFASRVENHDVLEVYPSLSMAVAALAVNLRVMEEFEAAWPRKAGASQGCIVATQADIEAAAAKFFREATYLNE